MAKLRKFAAYRRLDARPYTRRSKFRKKAYVRSSPPSKVVRYIMGDQVKPFSNRLTLFSKEAIQIRHNAIESARMAANRHLEATLGKTGFRFLVRMYPHHVLRENALASGAGADRLSTGMAGAFGKAIGVAARLSKGSPLFSVEVDKEKLVVAKEALKRASYKIPCSNYITEEEPGIKQK